MIEGLTPVLPQHTFDEAALFEYLRHELGIDFDRATVRQFAGGQSNPTYYIESPDGGFVVRRKPPGELLPSAHAVDREYRVMKALWDTDVPVPEVLLLCEDEAVIGTIFFVMRHVEGRVITDTLLPGFTTTTRRSVYNSLVGTLAALHNVDPAAFGLGDYGRSSDYFARQIRRWSGQYSEADLPAIQAMERLIEWLPENIPDGDDTAIVHGDFRLGNMILHPTAPRVEAVLDWELSTLGHPLADLGYLCMGYHTSTELYGFGDVDPPVFGIPSEKSLIAEYCRLTGRDGIPDWPFYLAFALFRMASILHGIAGRVKAGTASAPNAAERGALAGKMADYAWAVVEEAG
ncbi:MAG: phosphotransferase [Proteobacteria bacterium]|nr:phosphotransferase [Pseudomonadota bacterium]